MKVRFLKLKGFDRPILEVYGQTHVGNGELYLYEIKDTETTLLLEAPAAVDFYADGAKNPENLERYGYDACGEVFKDGVLKSEYRDLNGDGISDLRITGVADMLCEEYESDGNTITDSRQVTVKRRRVERMYFWQPELRQFIEQHQLIILLVISLPVSTQKSLQ